MKKKKRDEQSIDLLQKTVLNFELKSNFDGYFELEAVVLILNSINLAELVMMKTTDKSPA